MAAVHPLRPSPPILSTSTNGLATAPEGPKLRNSCDACASSKLKCSKGRPSCARCAKRGLSCDYCAVKRAGRKPNNRSSGSGSSSASSTDQLMHQSPQTSVHEIPDMLQDLFGPMDQSLASAFPDTDNMFDPDLSSPISFSTDMSDFDIFGAADYLSAGMENSSSNISGGLFDAFPMVEDSVSKHLAISFPDSTPGAMTSLSKEVQECQEVRATATPCSCLVQALGLMKHTEEKSITRATQDVSNVSGTPSIQAAIAQNEATIEAISKMLECSYLQDGYLLAVASLIIFKVLGCYAAVARTMPSLQGPQAGRLRSPSSSEQTLQSPAIVGNHRHESEDSARITAQLILNELHRVRRLIDQLSVKLKMRAAQQGRVEGGEMPGSLDMDCEMTLPPVAVMYEQVDVDLRKQLKELSRKIIGRLRKL